MNKHFCCGSYEQHGKDIGSLVDQKQAAYGDSFHRASEVMQILYPDGIRVDQYQDVLTMIRVVDKLFRIATKKDAFGESPWKDIAGYGLLASKDTEPAFPGSIDYGQGGAVIDLNTLAEEIHATATEKGWWERDANTDALIVLDEALELQREFAHGIGHHESTQCPGYRNDEIECADVIIAALSLARQQGWNIGGAVLAKAEFNKTR